MQGSISRRVLLVAMYTKVGVFSSGRQPSLEQHLRQTPNLRSHYYRLAFARDCTRARIDNHKNIVVFFPKIKYA